MGQLGNRIQHALRAYTPNEQKYVRAAASSFRENPAFDTEEVITDLGVGEALVSLLGEKGAPAIVGRTLIRPPASRLGPASKAERKDIIAASPVGEIYDTPIDRESAYEILEGRTEPKAKDDKPAKKAEKKKAAKKTTKSSSRKTKTVKDTVLYEAKLVTRQILRSQGRAILRGILGSMTRR